jgi:hypothetical protein
MMKAPDICGNEQPLDEIGIVCSRRSHRHQLPAGGSSRPAPLRAAGGPFSLRAIDGQNAGAPKQLRSLGSVKLHSPGSITGRRIMDYKLTSWLLSLALAVLLFGIVSVALFNRMHESL